MIIIVTLTKEEFKKATKLFFFKREIVKRLFAVFAITLILDAFRFGESKFVWTINLIKFIGLFGLVYFFLFIVPYWIFKEKPSVFSSFNEIKTKYEIGEDSLSITLEFPQKHISKLLKCWSGRGFSIITSVISLFLKAFSLPAKISLKKDSPKKCIHFRKMQLEQTLYYDHGCKLFYYQPFQGTS